MSDRPFKVLGIQQIAIGGLDKSKLSRLWIDTLGLTLTGNFRSERENVDEDIAAIGSGPFKVEVDLMQPIDPGKAPKVHEPQLNHIGLWIDNLAAMARARSKLPWPTHWLNCGRLSSREQHNSATLVAGSAPQPYELPMARNGLCWASALRRRRLL